MIRQAAVALAAVGSVLIPTTVAHTHTHTHTTQVSHVTQRPAAKAHGLAALRHAASRFRNLQRAENAGYGFFTDAKGIACIAMPAMKGMPSPGGMGVHFVNGTLVGDATEQIRRPEAMVYRIDKSGKLVLAAAEYVVIQSAWDATHSAPPKLFGHRFMLTPAGNRYGLPAFYSLHAWAWYHNPAGNFAMWNPRVHC